MYIYLDVSTFRQTDTHICIYIYIYLVGVAPETFRDFTAVLFEGRKEGRKEGRREGREGGWKDGRNKGRRMTE
jgi:predicted transposase YdaD